MKSSLLKCLVLLVVFAFSSGCASYKLGLPSAKHSGVFVKPVLNDSPFAEIEPVATASIRKHIDETSNLKSVNLGQADAILETRITDLNREIAAVQSSDVGRGRKFELQFQVEIRLMPVNAPVGDPLIQRTIEVRQDILAAESQVDAERQAGPEIARKIGRRVAEAISDTW